MESLDPLTKVLMIGIPCMTVIFTVLIVLAILARKKQEKLNDAAPERTLSAALIKKHKYATRHSVSAPVHYYLTFQTTDGETMEFEVPSGTYRAFDEGESGDLTLQGTRFIRFSTQQNTQ